MLEEKQAKKKLKEAEQIEKDKRLQKLKSQVRYRFCAHILIAGSLQEGG